MTLCHFCWNGPVGNAAHWIGGRGPSVGPCPRCNKTFPKQSDEARAAQQEARDAYLDQMEANDIREQERLAHESDLRYEYNKPEYFDEGW